MAFAMHRAQIEKLIAKGVALFVLCKHVLQSEGEFAQAGCFGPASIHLSVAGELKT